MPKSTSKKKKTEKVQQKRGRPSKYNDEVVDEILSRLKQGETLLNICKDDHIPDYATITNWMFLSKTEGRYDNFFERCQEARAIGAFAMVEQANEIADDMSRDLLVQYNNQGKSYYVGNPAAVARDKLRIQTKMRLAAMFNSMCQPQEKPAVEVNVGNIELVPPEKPKSLPEPQNVIDVSPVNKTEKIEE